MVVVSPKSNLGCGGGLRTDGFMAGSWSDHARIMVGSSSHCKYITFSQKVFIYAFWICHFSWRAQWKGYTSVAPRIVNDVSYVVRLKNMVHFTCQAQHLVRLEMTRINHANDFWWQGQYLVIEVGGVASVAPRIANNFHM